MGVGDWGMDAAPGVPGGQVASFSGADGWMPALLTPAPLRSQAGPRRRIPGPFHILFLLLQEQLPGSEGVGDTRDGGVVLAPGGTGASAERPGYW